MKSGMVENFKEDILYEVLAVLLPTKKMNEKPLTYFINYISSSAR